MSALCRWTSWSALCRWTSWFALFSLIAIVVGDDGLLPNGDFETAPQPDGFPDTSAGEITTSIPEWHTNGTVELVSTGHKQGAMMILIPQGLHAVRLGNDAEIRQTIKLEKGSNYSITFSAARTCAQFESLNVSVPPSSQAIDLQTIYTVEGWDRYAWAFMADSEKSDLIFRNTGMEDDPTCGPILDDIAIKKLFTPEKVKGNLVINGDFEEGPWMFRNTSLGVLLPTGLDQDISPLPGWSVDSNRAVRYIDSYHYVVPQGKRALELLSGKEGMIAQMVSTVPNKQYNLTFLVGDAGDVCQTPLALIASAEDQTNVIHYSRLGNSNFQRENLTFTARAERTRIAFYSVYYNTRRDDKTSLCGPTVDDVVVMGISKSPGKQWSPWLLIVFLIFLPLMG